LNSCEIKNIVCSIIHYRKKREKGATSQQW